MIDEMSPEKLQELHAASPEIFWLLILAQPEIPEDYGLLRQMITVLCSAPTIGLIMDSHIELGYLVLKMAFPVIDPASSTHDLIELFLARVEK